jgi:hypothetical protein
MGNCYLFTATVPNVNREQLLDAVPAKAYIPAELYPVSI